MNTKLATYISIPVAVLSLLGLIFFSSQAGRSPLERQQLLDYPQFALLDNFEHYVVVDTSLRRVMISDPQGNMSGELIGGNRDDNRFFYADQVFGAGVDSFFLLNYVLDDNGMFLKREEIQEYDLQGRLTRVFYRREYDAENRSAELVQRGEIFSPRVMREYLYFFLIDDAGIQLIRKSLNREATEKLGEIFFRDANAYISDIEWLNTDEFVIAHKHGHLIRGNIFGELQRLELYPEGFDPLTAEVTDPDQSFGGFYDPQVPRWNFWDLAVSEDGWVYASDLIGQRIVAMPQAEILDPNTFALSFETVLDRTILSQQGFSDEPFYYYRLGPAPDGFVVPYDFGIYHYNGSEVSDHFEYFSRPFSWNVQALVWWTALILAITSLVALVIVFYIRVLNRRVSIILKQLLIIVPLMAVGIVFISTILLRNFMSEYEEGNRNNILALTQTISQSIDGDLFYSIESMENYMNDDYRQIRQELRRALSFNRDEWNEGLYFAVYQVLDETLYGFMYLNNRISMRHPFNWYDDPQSVYRLANEGEVKFEQVQDISGNWLYGVGPIYDSNNNVVALLEIGTDLFSFTQNIQRLQNQAIGLMSLIGGLVVIFITFMTYLVLRNLRVLRRGVERVAEGDWNHQIELRSNDEVSDLGNRFNHMSNSISSYLDQIKDMNDSYQKFFPDQFLQYLDLQSLTEVKLGDQVQKKMTIMFSDIRAFTSISEKMSPEENFNFLNSYLNLVGPIIRNNKGFIDKYIGDAIMALFPDRVDDSIQASISMLQDLREFNNARADLGQAAIQIGIGIHTGDLMLGILGETQRMQGTVIADSVNFAARLETLSKQMGASLLVSSDSLQSIHGSDAYLKRYMGKIRVIGKTEAAGVYEILNGLPEEEIEQKLRTKEQLSEAITAFEAGDLSNARNLFVELQKNASSRRIARLFLGTIERYVTGRRQAEKAGNEPEAWKGVLIPETK